MRKSCSMFCAGGLESHSHFLASFWMFYCSVAFAFSQALHFSQALLELES